VLIVALLPKYLNFAKIGWSMEDTYLPFYSQGFKKEEEVIMYTIFLSSTKMV